ncbi:MAG: low molecular weight phosphotyrosine protein phosphatase, partial [Clostridia bacterium]|nr:low molecular weight phosphotyrosine protein phosphatase [Clostridia bacterium]
ATSTEEIGNPVYPPAQRELISHGLSPKGKYAVQLTRADYEKYDYFVGMDSANIRNMHRIFGSDPDGKILKLLDLTGKGGDVADPWYVGSFDRTYADCEAGCRAILSLYDSDADSLKL